MTSELHRPGWGQRQGPAGVEPAGEAAEVEGNVEQAGQLAEAGEGMGATLLVASHYGAERQEITRAAHEHMRARKSNLSVVSRRGVATQASTASNLMQPCPARRDSD